MELELFNAETNKLWKTAAGGKTDDQLQFELNLQKKLLNFFQVGDYYYYLFNLETLDFDLVSSEIKTMLGYQPSQVDINFFMEMVHPDDRSWFLAFETKTAEFLASLPVEKLMKYKVRYDFRIRKSDGAYIRILHQVAVVQHDENGGILRTLGIHTDITHLKSEGKPVASYIGMDGEPSYLNVDVKNDYVKSKEVLTRREKEVLRLMIKGKLSKEISDALNISKQTVDSHRKNMLTKTNLKNTVELVVAAINRGWL
ncbi:hypothetical protein FO440_00130 [Mucilaginibacter corticis]|uniref:PAS domain-containing protein n=1 Tax=Mucilaginibacter corticis TaxID=2597670 RepID=A0A556MRP4_9SPHI|nr:LuxR C-terminal-related transcriptional regulator [Mucilaginibacter corticis]TSJ42634.1 hypothetical protein FO440_00130 [Mucilaginibacter corticis]